MKDTKKIAVIGLGYVGLPLLIEFGKIRSVIGYDNNIERIKNLKKGNDKTNEVKKNDIKKSKYLQFTNKINDLKNCQIFIVTVPTPINNKFEPDLTFIKKSMQNVGKILKKNDLVILESTVYPGTTEEIVIPILEKYSKLKLNKGFFVGYSPERINPGDKIRTLSSIKKVTSGSNKKTSKEVDNLYKQIIKAGTHNAPNIKVAEASKIIENVQRDLNISLMNELSLIFDKLSINTYDVLKASKTKWNFLPFEPGLVGGHCIGVDPYYLTYKSKLHGYNPKIILSGRKVNNAMPIHIAKNVLKKINYNNLKAKVNIGIMGISFKENCPDIRNSKVCDIITYLQNYNITIQVYDPVVDYGQLPKFKNNVKFVSKFNNLNALIITVNHKEFKKYNEKHLISLFKKNLPIIFDIKSHYNKTKLESLGAQVWSL